MTSSINTNFAAQTALQNLQSTNKALLRAQSIISTGYKVASAEDNAAYFAIATTQRSDSSALSAVKDALGLGSSTIDVQSAALNSANSIVSNLKSKLVAAREPGLDRSTIQSEITQLQSQLQSVASSTNFSGQNYLSVDSSATGYNATKQIVASFSRDAAGAVSVGVISFDSSAYKLYDSSATADGIVDGLRDATGAISATGTFSIATLDISALSDSTADLATLDSYIKGADTALKDITDAASDLGSVKQRVSLQKDFVDTLRNAIDQGVSQLVDADLNEESTRLQALQVKQQLGVQALSIANQSSQSILSLFKG